MNLEFGGFVTNRFRRQAVMVMESAIGIATQQQTGSCSCATTVLIVLAGTERPLPTDPPDGLKIAVFLATTWPSVPNSGPPELPLSIAASVWL